MLKWTTRSLALILAVALVPVLCSAPVQASGARSAPPPTQVLTPEEQSVEHFNRGIRLRDKAWKFEEKAREATDDATRAELKDKMTKQFEKAVKEFERSVEANPANFQAQSSLGYSLRRTGNYQLALTAYDKALSLNPNYVEAIEYRAEAYLGLNRLKEAKQAYLKLFNMDRGRADELLKAMQGWVEAREAKPGSVDASTLHEFASWVAEREQVHQQTASLSAPHQSNW